MMPRPGAPRAHAVLLAAGLASGLLAAACAPAPAPPRPPGPPPAPAITDLDREMLALAFIAYTGERIAGPDQEVSRQLAPCFVAELARQPLVEEWELVWGPVVYRFEHTLFNDNLLYAVRRRGDPATLAVSTRGTNSRAVFDWLVEDLEVFELRDWPFGDPADLDPKIARGTMKGLEILQGLVPPEGVPGAGQGIAAFLAGQVAVNAPRTTTIHVTGHSLGGALSPVLALWLADTTSDWDPEGRSTLQVTPFAGPTQGDADFAAYYDRRLGATTTRFHDAIDIATLVWNATAMAEIPTLYLPVAKPDEAEKLALDLLIDGVKHKDYQQIDADQPPLGYRVVNPEKTSLSAQADWQHHCGYVCGLGVQDTLLPVSPDCRSEGENLCLSCPTG